MSYIHYGSIFLGGSSVPLTLPDLITVDLNRIDIVGHMPFAWSITGMSTADPGVPLTVGTSGGLHLYDWRASLNLSGDRGERVERRCYKPDLYNIIFDDKPLPAWSNSQPSALAIAH